MTEGHVGAGDFWPPAGYRVETHRDETNLNLFYYKSKRLSSKQVFKICRHAVCVYAMLIAKLHYNHLAAFFLRPYFGEDKRQCVFIGKKLPHMSNLALLVKYSQLMLRFSIDIKLRDQAFR